MDYLGYHPKPRAKGLDDGLSYPAMIAFKLVFFCSLPKKPAGAPLTEPGRSG